VGGGLGSEASLVGLFWENISLTGFPRRLLRRLYIDALWRCIAQLVASWKLGDTGHGDADGTEELVEAGRVEICVLALAYALPEAHVYV
jgi:hypothetical protein